MLSLRATIYHGESGFWVATISESGYLRAVEALDLDCGEAQRACLEMAMRLGWVDEPECVGWFVLSEEGATHVDP